MIREGGTLLFILLCLMGQLGFFVACASLFWRKEMSRIPVWMWSGLIFFTLYATFCAPVFYSSTMEYYVGLGSGFYAKVYWIVNSPVKVLIYLAAYRGTHNLIDEYLFMPRYVVSLGAAFYTAIGCGA